MNNLTGFLVVAPLCVGVNELFSLKVKALTTPYRVLGQSSIDGL